MWSSTSQKWKIIPSLENEKVNNMQAKERLKLK